MPSYFITGVARGLGYEFVKQYSEDPNNTVVGLVRRKAETDKKISEDADLKDRKNIHIVQGDIKNYEDLKAAAEFTSSVTGGKLDYVIGNAGIVPMFDQFDAIGTLGEKPEELTAVARDLFDTHVIANVHLINLFMPLILKGDAKKVVIISSGFADIEFTREYGIEVAALYSSSKVACNMIVAKFDAQYRPQGVHVLALCPGVVEVGHYNSITEDQLQKLMANGAKFMKYAPDFSGPKTPEKSVTMLREVISNSSIEKGNGGDFLSHYGNKKWIGA